jgi:hypothetical protein
MQAGGRFQRAQGTELQSGRVANKEGRKSAQCVTGWRRYSTGKREGGIQPLSIGMAMIKFRPPPAFSRKQEEDAFDWFELYETTVEYNRWG